MKIAVIGATGNVGRGDVVELLMCYSLIRKIVE